MKSAVRRVLLMSAIMSPSALYALGLGEIKLNSALNQPFDAEIELVSAAEEDLSALRATLASSDTFVRYGLEKPAYLSDFTFRVVRSGGRDVLRITSPRPVTEPFVTMLVEANWPRGRLLREYTVLLDPPVFSPTPSVAEAPVATPRATAPPPPPASRPSPVSAAAPSAPRASRPVAVAASIEPGSTYRVQRNDTLWRIASAANPGTRSDVNRAMVAIYQANPAAFGGNINVLRAGSELTIPATSDLTAISASAAADEVARQYRMWRDGSTAAAAATPDGGRLRLVTPEQGAAVPSTSTSVPASPAPDGAAGELQSRVQQLEAELAEARRLLEVRNAELATLQGAAPTDEVAVEAGVEAAGPEPVEAPAETAAEGPVAAQPTPAVPEAEPEPVPVPAAAPEATPSLFDRLREYWWALLALLVAALGIAAFLRSRREAGSAEESLEEALSRRAGDDLRSRAAVAARSLESDIVVEERHATEPAAAPTVMRAPEPSRKPVSIEDTLSGEAPMNLEAGDPLAEADFHMAYGLYDQAAELVQVAARREPGRRDLKLKLLEIFFVWGNRDRFLEVARDMNASRTEAQPGEWDKVLIMGKQLAPEDPLFAGAAQAAVDSLDMELQGGDSSVDLDVDAGEAQGPDFDLSDEEHLQTQALGGDSGLDFVLDEPVRGEDEDLSSLAQTIESPRAVSGSVEDPTAEVPIEDLALDVGDIEGLDELGGVDEMPGSRADRDSEDTVETPVSELEDAGLGEDLLSATSILKGDQMTLDGETEEDIVDLTEATGELPAMDVSRADATGILSQVDFSIDGEAATMSEVGTKLDLARAYVDMGDPEGARSILEEVLKEGNATQKQEAERLMAGLP
jgi:pilus assembly protein FimV